MNPGAFAPDHLRTSPDQVPFPTQSAVPLSQKKAHQSPGKSQESALDSEMIKSTGQAPQAKAGSRSSAREPAYTLNLSQAEQRVLQQLKSRDREVKAHERAHIAAGGQYVQGGANYSYRIGPDGKMYAVGGEVSIDVSPVPGDPQATIEKAQAIQRAARAPAQPSAQDAAVAAQAASMEMQAQMEVQREEREADRAQGNESDPQAGAAVRSAHNQAAENGPRVVRAGLAGMSGRGGLAPESRDSGFPDRISAFQGLHEYARMAARTPSLTAGLNIQA
jgi:hypothetical protein